MIIKKLHWLLSFIKCQSSEMCLLSVYFVLRTMYIFRMFHLAIKVLWLMTPNFQGFKMINCHWIFQMSVSDILTAVCCPQNSSVLILFFIVGLRSSIQGAWYCVDREIHCWCNRPCLGTSSKFQSNHDSRRCSLLT